MPVVGLVFDFVIGESRTATRTPVDDVVTLIDQPLVKKLFEDLGNRTRAAVVKSKTLTLPIRRIA